MDSIPLEWDHDYDLSRDLESASRTLPSEDEEGEEDKEFYLRGAAGLSGRREKFLLGIHVRNALATGFIFPERDRQIYVHGHSGIIGCLSRAGQRLLSETRGIMMSL